MIKKIWLVPHPTSQFVEDVKQLASNGGLRIIDAKFAGEINQDYIEYSPPVLTPKKVEKKVKAKTVKE